MTAPYSTRSHSTRSLKKNMWEWVEMVITHHIPLPFSVVPGTGGNVWEWVGMGEPSGSQKQLMKIHLMVHGSWPSLARHGNSYKTRCGNWFI